MKSAIDQFRENIVRVRSLGAIHGAIKAQTTIALDLSDILRAQLVLAASALDHYVHEVVRLGMLEIHAGHRNSTPAFLKFPITMENVHQTMTTPISVDWLETAIRTRNGWQSFQQPDNISNAIRLISDIRLWDEVALSLGAESSSLVKEQLKLIVERRNKIAHEADIDPTFPGKRWPIDEKLVNDATDFIEQIVETIHRLL